MSIKIGLTCYYSTIYPTLSSDIAEGFIAALPDALVKENFFQFIPEYVRQASNRQTGHAVQKLISFDRVDFVCGILNYKAVPHILPILDRTNTIGFFCDMGELIPYTHIVSDNLFLNSFQLWQSEYALGFWAYKNFGDNGSVVMSLFDCGFHLQSAFRQGTIAAGSKTIDYTVLHDDPKKLNITAKSIGFFASVKDKFPSFIHGIFCGKEAVEFMAAYRASDLYGKVPLIITGHMAAEEIFGQVDTDMKVYSASMYNYNSPDKLNTKFKKTFESKTGIKANIFALLGYEMGLALADLVPSLRKRDFGAVRKALKEQTIKGPRGTRNFYPDSDYAMPVIDIEQVHVANKMVNKFVIEQGRAMKYNDAIYEEIHRECVSGWQNPYLCV